MDEPKAFTIATWEVMVKLWVLFTGFSPVVESVTFTCGRIWDLPLFVTWIFGFFIFLRRWQSS
jgi:hypothetical protein